MTGPDPLMTNPAPLTGRRRPGVATRIAIVAGAVAAGGMALPVPAHSQPDPRFDALVALTEAKMEEFGVPGVALGILHDGVVTTRGLGVTSVEDPIPVTPHTVFPIASISKTFAATMVMRLAEQGRIDLEAPVRRYLPEFQVEDETVSRDATIWHLVTHTGGWEGQISGPERGEDTLRNFVATVMRTNMQVAPPAAAWSYNNAGFSALGRVIEQVTGTSINAAVRDLVLTPLGLEHAGSTAGDFLANRFAAGHATRPAEAPRLLRPFSPATSVTAGGLGMCVTDLLTYARFHLGDGTTAAGERLLSRASLERMRTPQLRKQGTDDDIGLAWHLRRMNGLLTISHGGTLAGHVLLLEIIPERGFAIAMLTNASSGWRLIQDVAREALSSYLGASFAPNQAIAHRGLLETLPSVEPPATQPDPAPYVGRYRRPMNHVRVRSSNGGLVVQVEPNSGDPGPEMPIAFFGPDRAVVTDGPDRGQTIEFVRDARDRVQWVRVVGRVAVRVD
jgi:CubicO group peptidase (beta-lactamase class C family)